MTRTERFGFLLCLEDFVGKADIDIGVIVEHAIQNLVQVHLLVLHPIGIVGLVLDRGEIEFGDEAFLAVAELPDRVIRPVLDDAVHRAQLARYSSVGG